MNTQFRLHLGNCYHPTKMKLMLTAFVVGFGVTSVQPNDQLDARVCTGRMHEDRKIQVDTQFHNLFDSITTNDTKRSETYRSILEKEAKRERDAFSTIKGELRVPRQKHARKQENFQTQNKGLVRKRETRESRSGPAENNTVSNSSTSNTKRLYVELPSIGYNGTWEKFCDTEEIESDYGDYKKHELKKLRTLICYLHETGEMDRSALRLFALYKYGVGMGSTIDDFLFKLASNFAGNDKKKTDLLVSGEPVDMNTTCYHTCLRKFSQTCIEEKNPYFQMFKTLIARACEMFWLSAADIKDEIERVCGGRLVVAEIDWESIVADIKYKEE